MSENRVNIFLNLKLQNFEIVREWIWANIIGKNMCELDQMEMYYFQLCIFSKELFINNQGKLKIYAKNIQKFLAFAIPWITYNYTHDFYYDFAFDFLLNDKEKYWTNNITSTIIFSNKSLILDLPYTMCSLDFEDTFPAIFESDGAKNEQFNIMFSDVYPLPINLTTLNPYSLYVIFWTLNDIFLETHGNHFNRRRNSTI